LHGEPKMKYLILLLLSLSLFAAESIITPPGTDKAYFTDNLGNIMPATISYTTDGAGNLKLINSSDPVDDSIAIPPGTGKMYLNGTDGNKYPAMVLYSTDGQGNLIPIPIGGSGTYSFTAPLNLASSTVSIPLATNSVNGYLSSADRTAFNAKVNRSGDTMTGPLVITNVDLVRGGSIRGNNSVDELPLDELLTYPSIENVILMGNSVNTNGVGTLNTKYFKTQMASGLAYLDLAGADASNNVRISSPNAQQTHFMVGGMEGLPAVKILNGGNLYASKAVRVGSENNTIFAGDVDIISSQSDGQDGTAGIGMASYRNTDIWGSFAYGVRYRGTVAAPLAVEEGDVLMEFGGIGWDGANAMGGGELMWVVDDAVSTGIIPSKAELYVTNKSGVTTKGMMIDSDLQTTFFGDLKTNLSAGYAAIDSSNKLYSIPSAPTKVIQVDGNRSDTYTADGSNFKPFKTIGAATSIATAGSIIKVVPGTYTEDVVLPLSVSFEGLGSNNVIIVGNFSTTGSGNISIKNITFSGSGKTVTFGCPVSIIDSYSYSAVTTSAVVQAYNFHITPATGVVPLTVSSGKYQGIMATIASTGDVGAIVVNGGTLILNTIQVSGSSASATMLTSTAGQVVLLNSYVLNMGGGAAANIANGATTSPNMLNGVFAVGNFATGTAYTSIEGLNITGTLSGSNLIYRSSGMVKNDSTITGATVSDALNTLGTLSSASTTGLLSSTNWNQFNNKPSGSGSLYGLAYWSSTSTLGALTELKITTSNPKRITMGGTGTPATLSNVKINSYDTVNGYLQNNIQNLSTGASASSDWIATADNGTDTTNYVDMGINGSGYSVGTWTISGALDAYLYSQSSHLSLGTAAASKDIIFHTGGTLAANERMRISDSKIVMASGVVLNTTGTQPTCEVATRGMLWYVQGATGVADTFQVCMKNSSDVYAWAVK
jgi:hypothetical protein